MNHFDQDQFSNEIYSRVKDYVEDKSLQSLAKEVLDQMNHKHYAYNYHWLGRPIIQIPQDTVTFQEMIWEVKPDCIIETGIAHGGSLIFSASMLAILETCNLVRDPIVIGIDIDIRNNNRNAIESHPLFKYIKLVHASSTDPSTVNMVNQIAGSHSKVMVFLDSNHTHDHVLAELNAYAQLVTIGSYCVILDTGIEDISPDAVGKNRPWCRGNSPKSALNAFLEETNEFMLDSYYHQKSIVTSFPGGVIRKVT